MSHHWQVARITPLLLSLDISQSISGYVPSEDALARFAVKGPERTHPLDITHLHNPSPITVTPAAVGVLWGYLPHLVTLIVTNAATINALPVELLRCPRLQVVTATPDLIIMPPPEVTTGMARCVYCVGHVCVCVHPGMLSVLERVVRGCVRRCVCVLSVPACVCKCVWMCVDVDVVCASACVCVIRRLPLHQALPGGREGVRRDPLPLHQARVQWQRQGGRLLLCGRVSTRVLLAVWGPAWCVHFLCACA